MRRELLQAKRDALLLFVEVEDNDVELLVELNDFVRIVYATPRKVCDVDQAIYAAQVDEYAVRSDVLNRTFEHLAFLQLRDDLLLLCFEFSFDKCLVANHNVLVFLIDLNHLELHRFAHEDVIVANRLNINLATRQEGFDTKYVYNHTALRAAFDKALDCFFVLQCLVNAIPSFAQTSFFVRKNKLSFFVFLIFNVNFYFVAYLKFRIVTKFAYGDDAVALEADAYNYFALVD